MKNKTYLLAALVVLSFFPFNKVNADIAFSQEITLSSGWNVVSTPRILESHSFSVQETSDNFDIFALDASKLSGWATLSDLGQTEFTPLYGYFINNKTGSNQTLTFNYKANVSVSQRFFERTFPTSGWYSFGIANPTYAKKTGSDAADNNNPDFILNSLLGEQANYSTVIDFTDAAYSQGMDSVALSDPWGSRARSISSIDKTEINKLNDFRETKGYAIFIKNAGSLYDGFQNNDIPPTPACSDGEDNDSDDLVDMNDPGCVDAIDNSEVDHINASVTLSLNNSSPRSQEVVASQGTADNELDKLTTLAFNLRANDDDIVINNLTINVVKGGSGSATSQTAYIFDGSTELDNATISGGVALFSNLDYTVQKDTTKTLTVKIDIRNADSNIASFVTSVSATGITAKNSDEQTISTEGSATGDAISIRNSGLEITLVSKSITTSGVPQSNSLNSLSTSTLTATFNVKIKAMGNDIILGTVASATPLFNRNDSFILYKNGVISSVNLSTSTSYTIPSSCAQIQGKNSCTLAEGSEVTIPVTVQVPGRFGTGLSVDSGLYSVGLERMYWGNGNLSDFMVGDIIWRTADVSFP